MPRIRLALALAVAGLLALSSSIAAAHTVMTSPLPRDDSDSHKDPNGPCGVARAASQPKLAGLYPQTPLNVTWQETVDHPGCFVIDFASSNDSGWQPLATVAHDATGATPRPYSTTVTLPDIDCAECTLRIRQIMLNEEPAPGAACPPASLDAGQTYYSCANLSVVREAARRDPKGDEASSDGSCAYAPGTSATGSLWVILLGLAALGCSLRRQRILVGCGSCHRIS
jgi:hypothetical protein